ncbi:MULTISPECIES: hypothetical protein [unclassified Mesorhizobium]|uniref:hypothetical protein n=1 Tax=unclassified Mesorhizobium TaxID=325217 RepID=UPI000FD44934|nr:MULTISPECIES: hypothetical protein [unclassified Mesorhizobium]RVB80575.1 hypothetical protein EN885_01395 [Mesorhizobium sp. M6A.T.Cr.TU.014.01.1.1]RWP97566.1 MAG: hypothetical protein EOR91_29510 [Mesorhizobium sp.]RWQ10839.1 MAG: hypothetical protein EOR90_03535 [Mesorhizobium sp.]
MTVTLFRRLVAAERLLFASLDDDMLSFGAVAAMRGLLQRPTVALFLRAQKCFEAGRWYYRGKRITFRILRRIPRLMIATITPFDAAPQYAEVAHAGVCDPQYWDLQHDGKTMRQPHSTALAEEVLARAAGRRVLFSLSSFSALRGMDFLAQTLKRFPKLAERVLVVAAGRVPAASASLSASLLSSGALVIDRFVTSRELESLYGVADSVWACYAPEYDQASGIFGRAIQLGVPPITRKGSVIACFSAAAGINHFSVQYDDYEALAGLLEQLPSRHQLDPMLSETERVGLVSAWRRQFNETINAGLVGIKHPAHNSLDRIL